jgi:hypothetical protein
MKIRTGKIVNNNKSAVQYLGLYTDMTPQECPVLSHYFNNAVEVPDDFFLTHHAGRIYERGQI